MEQASGGLSTSHPVTGGRKVGVVGIWLVTGAEHIGEIEHSLRGAKWARASYSCVGCERKSALLENVWGNFQ